MFLLWNDANQKGGALTWAKTFVCAMRGATSGGTAATMLAVVAEATHDPKVRRLLGNPHALDPVVPRGRGRDPFEADVHGVSFDADIDRWTAPFVMATVNTRIVRRSSALVGYGKGFRYREAMCLPKGPKGFVTSALVSAGTTGFTI